MFDLYGNKMMDLISSGRIFNQSFICPIYWNNLIFDD